MSLRYSGSLTGSGGSGCTTYAICRSERLFEQVVNNFDLKRRIGLLNLRLSYHSDFMAAFGEHVRHRFGLFPFDEGGIPILGIPIV